MLGSSDRNWWVGEGGWRSQRESQKRSHSLLSSLPQLAIHPCTPRLASTRPPSDIRPLRRNAEVAWHDWERLRLAVDRPHGHHTESF